MNSLQRMLDVLTLFTPSQPVIDVELICTKLNYTPASAYRYVRELSDAGLLVRLPRGYAVGPRVIELERHMTQFDPLLAASTDLVEGLVAETGLELLISERYGSKVINILQYSGPNERILHFGRGQPLDLFRSATARVILAYLLPRQLRRLFDQADPAELEHVGSDWKVFNKSMLQIRKAGYCVSEGVIDPGNCGIAAPIFDEKRRILGSLTLAGRAERFYAIEREHLAGLVMDAANEITRRIVAPETSVP